MAPSRDHTAQLRIVHLSDLHFGEMHRFRPPATPAGDPRTVINSDGWRGYNGLVDLGYGHFRVDHSRDEFTKGTVHINGIEGFWGLAKVRLAKFKGLPQHTFHLHLKETEWRYNHRHTDKYQTLLRYLRKNPLS